MPFPIGTQKPPKKKKKITQALTFLSLLLATRLCSWWIGREDEELETEREKKM